MRCSKNDWLRLRPFSRHGAVLVVSGLSYMTMGFNFLLDELSPARERSLSVALDMLTPKMWGWMFVVAGLAAIISARWPPFATSWGYAVLTGFSSGWAAIYILGYIIEDGPRSNLTYGAIWALLAFLWWAVSGLVNPARQLREAKDGVD